MASDGLHQAPSSSFGSFAIGVFVGGSLAAVAAYAGYRLLQTHGTEVASPSRKGESSFRSHRQANTALCSQSQFVLELHCLLTLQLRNVHHRLSWPMEDGLNS